MGLTWLTPTDITPGSTSSWLDCDVSGSVPAGATGVVLHCVNTNASTHYAFGFRKNGSTDSRIQNIVAQQHFWAAIGVDGSRILELYVGSTTGIKVYLVGYFDADAVFLTNGVDKSLGTADAWTDIDLSGDTGADTATGAIFELTTAAAGPGFGLRKNGSTDNRTSGSVRHVAAMVGVDGSEVCEGWVGATTHGLHLVGYVTAGFIFNTNATDVSPAVEDVYWDLACLPSGASGALLEVHSANATYPYALRKDGSSEDLFGVHRAHAWGLIEARYGITEGKVDSLGTTGFYLVGYSTGGPTVERPGAQVSGGGAVAPSASRRQPASVSVSAVAGTVPAASRCRPASFLASAEGEASAAGSRYRPAVATVAGEASASGLAARLRGAAATWLAGGESAAASTCTAAGAAGLGAAVRMAATGRANRLATALFRALAALLAGLASAPRGDVLFVDATSRSVCAAGSTAADARPAHPAVVAASALDETWFRNATPSVTVHVPASR